jgi:beta-aspartyl-dipeptidase (metallo-type)
MLIWIQGAEVYAPEPLGVLDVLLAGDKILYMGKGLNLERFQVPFTKIDGSGKRLLPGFIDGHVHIIGGGGEGGFKTRTPELKLSDMIQAGVTTVVGCLGTDGVMRSMENLIAKVKGLKEEGVSAYCYTGSYQLPLRSLTGDVMKDICCIDEVIGVGEVAINDHRSSFAGVDAFRKVTAEARVAGILSGKAGIVNVHLGDGTHYFDDIYAVLEQSELPINQFLPTHCNRNPEIFTKSIEYGLKGGNLDFTTSTTPQFLEEGEVACGVGLDRLLKAGVDIDRVTFTSDGQGSLPKFDASGTFVGLDVGRLSSLYGAVKEAVLSVGVPFEQAIRVITSNPADRLKLKNKGRLQVDLDADCVLVDGDTLDITDVIAKGKPMLLGGKQLVFGVFDQL